MIAEQSPSPDTILFLKRQHRHDMTLPLWRQAPVFKHLPCDQGVQPQSLGLNSHKGIRREAVSLAPRLLPAAVPAAAPLQSE